MHIFRLPLLIIGILAALMGVVWIGQGTGVFPYPASSFMVNQAPWIWRGAMLAVAGIVAIVVSRKV